MTVQLVWIRDWDAEYRFALWGIYKTYDAAIKGLAEAKRHFGTDNGFIDPQEIKE